MLRLCLIYELFLHNYTDEDSNTNTETDDLKTEIACESVTQHSSFFDFGKPDRLDRGMTPSGLLNLVKLSIYDSFSDCVTCHRKLTVDPTFLILVQIRFSVLDPVPTSWFVY